MTSIVLAWRSCSLRPGIIRPVLLYSKQTNRAASLNSAIGRGLRKSKGVGFRGRERSQQGHNADFNRGADKGPGLIRRGGDIVPGSRPQLTRDGWSGRADRSENISEARDDAVTARLRRGKRNITDDGEKPRRSRAARFYDPDSSFGKRSLANPQNPASNRFPTRGFSAMQRKPFGGLKDFRDKTSRRESETIRDSARYPAYSNSSREAEVGGKIQMEERTRIAPPLDAKQRAAESDRMAMQRNPDGSKLSASRLAYLARTAGNTQSRTTSTAHEPEASKHGASANYIPNSSNVTTRERGTEPILVDRKFTQTMDKRLPISIPYTTAASEFLYGTSVVEAALRSHRIPRRKLYKLYIYSGENRENAERDSIIKGLAKTNRIDIVHITADRIALMDKMSGGRPHNGYILEASPLPKLPVAGLGALGSKNDKLGFSVTLDYQSAEEALVNGTSDFIPVPRDVHERNPLVLLLDSIVDPGNLGGIIRTAAFLGVTAIAISTRNSASFTPVVLKASAGASENITLFSVKQPAGFLVDSKAAGWKVYAAVAPPANRTSSIPPYFTTDQLEDPLQADPCILMLGSEGEGLRWNLRSKADIEVAIQGSGQSKGVDSLNVSVATGILCDAFLRRRDPFLGRQAVKESSKPQGDLF